MCPPSANGPCGTAWFMSQVTLLFSRCDDFTMSSRLERSYANTDLLPIEPRTSAPASTQSATNKDITAKPKHLLDGSYPSFGEHPSFARLRTHEGVQSRQDDAKRPVSSTKVPTLLRPTPNAAHQSPGNVEFSTFRGPQRLNGRQVTKALGTPAIWPRCPRCGSWRWNGRGT